MAAPNIFADLFGRSPVDPLQKHISVAHNCATELLPYFQAVYKEDWSEAASIRDKIVDLENEADSIQNSILLHLPKSLFLPVPRADLISLLATQDKIANRAKDIAGIILGRQMVVPGKLQKPVFEYLKRSLAASEQALKAINEVDELVDSAFGGREIRLIEKMLKKLDKLENETDQIEIRIRAALYAMESELNPIDVMFLYKIIDWIGDIADRAEQTGGKLLLLLAR